MHPLIETLPLPQRLALAYARPPLRDPTLGLLALDAHLARLVRQTREPLLGQARLAWWRERLEEPAARRPSGDPVLDLIGRWDGHEPALVALVDGWEHVLAETFDEAGAAAFAAGRGAAFAGLSVLAGEGDSVAAVDLAARRWALADLAANVASAGDRHAALAAAGELDRRHGALPAALRPLAVLEGLARRSLARGGGALVEGPLAGLAALRLGIFGR